MWEKTWHKQWKELKPNASTLARRTNQSSQYVFGAYCTLCVCFPLIHFIFFYCVQNTHGQAILVFHPIPIAIYEYKLTNLFGATKSNSKSLFFHTFFSLCLFTQTLTDSLGFFSIRTCSVPLLKPLYICVVVVFFFKYKKHIFNNISA